MRALITWIGPWLDKGEAAMLISIKNALNERISDINITASASSFYPQEIDITKYGSYDIKVLPGIFPSIISAAPKSEALKYKAIRIMIAFPSCFVQILANMVWLTLYKTLGIDVKFLNAGHREIVKEYIDAHCIILMIVRAMRPNGWAPIEKKT